MLQRMPILCVYCVALVSVGQTAEFTFTLGDFANGDWSISQEVIDDPFWATPGPGFSSATAFNWSTGGNPGRYRRVPKSNYRGDILVVSDIYTADSYALPGEGLESIRFRWDAITISSASDANAPFIPILIQDSVQYYSLAGVQYVMVDTGWQSLEWGPQSATDFDTNRFAVFGLAPADQVHPDFSSEGSPIQFGYATIGQVLGRSFLSVTNGVDNFTATFTPRAATIPEPSTPIALALLAIGWRLRSRVRHR